MPSLHEIEQTVATLWLDKQARAWLLSDRKGKPPASLKNADPVILDAVDKRGVALYGELISFGHHDVMQSIYPYCSKLIGKNWEDVVDDYLQRCPADHFNFNRLCSKFPQYMLQHAPSWLEKYPFIAELADYEWIELAKMEEDVDITVFPHEEMTSLDQLMALSPVLNPTVSVRRWQFDVLSIAERLENGTKPRKVKTNPVSVAVYRHPEDHLCKFVELGKASAFVAERAADNVSYAVLIKESLPLVGAPDPQAATVSVLNLFEELQQLRIFVGSRPVG